MRGYGLPISPSCARSTSGARRKFPKNDIQARRSRQPAVTDVQTYINTGNVLLTSTLTYLAPAGREGAGGGLPGRPRVRSAHHRVRPRGVGRRGEARRRPVGRARGADHALRHPAEEAPPPAAVAALCEVSVEGEHLVVDRRTAHLVLQHGYHESQAGRQCRDGPPRRRDRPQRQRGADPGAEVVPSSLTRPWNRAGRRSAKARIPSATSAVRSSTDWPWRSHSRAGRGGARVAALTARLVAAWASGAPAASRRTIFDEVGEGASGASG